MSTKKNVELPIDKKETFTSLSKNMNESDSTIELKLQTLYRLQQVDTNIDKIHMLRGELPEEVQDLEDEISGLQTRVTNIKEDIASLDSNIAHRKIEIEECQGKIKKYEEQKANVKNNREYDSISKEIEFQDLAHKLAEKKIKDHTVDISEKKALLQQTKENLSGREIDLKNKKNELVTIVKETEIEEANLLKEVKELEAILEERMIAAYRKVRSNARNKLAVVTVKRNACSGCFNKIPPQRQLDIALNKKIIVCEYCGRILVSSDFEQ